MKSKTKRSILIFIALGIIVVPASYYLFLKPDLEDECYSRNGEKQSTLETCHKRDLLYQGLLGSIVEEYPGKVRSSGFRSVQEELDRCKKLCQSKNQCNSYKIEYQKSGAITKPYNGPIYMYCKLIKESGLSTK